MNFLPYLFAAMKSIISPVFQVMKQTNMNNDFKYKFWALSKKTIDNYSSDFISSQYSPPWCQVWVWDPTLLQNHHSLLLKLMHS